MSATWRPGPQPRQTRLNLTAKIRRPRPRRKCPRQTPKSTRRPPPLIQRGRVIAFADDEEDSYWIGDVLHCIGDTSAKVHYRATQGSEIKTARFLPVHVEYPSCLSILTMKMTKRKLSPGCTSEPGLDRRHRPRRRLRFQRAAHWPTTADRALPQVSIRPQAHDHELNFFHRAVDPFWGGCQGSTHSPAPTGPSVALDTLLRP